ncbi:MAG: 3-phosphoshikimate 1-carboxyvinyltransferase [Acidobacteriota bacterium]
MKKFQKFKPSGEKISAPPSKSLMIRALAAGLLSEKSLVIDNFVLCDDSAAALKIIKTAGKKVELSDRSVIVSGSSYFEGGTVFNCGESALTLRLFTPLLALQDKEFTLSGSGSLLSRPVDMMKGPLKELGVDVISEGGYLPLKSGGRLKSGRVNVDGSVTSQFLSGLLMSLPLTDGDSEISVKELTSKKYIDLTMDLLDKFGIEIKNRDYETFFIKGNQKYSSEKYYIEGDWSGASFFLVMGALAGGITVKGLNNKSLQADRAILDPLGQSGALVEEDNNSVRVSNRDLKAFTFDATHCPDLFPPLVVLASGCRGTSEIKGVSRLRFKESDRGEALLKEFGTLGIDIKTEGDSMFVKGGKVKGGKVSSHGDHRIAMALITASVISGGVIEIDDVKCINKSYPQFIEHMNTLSI